MNDISYRMKKNLTFILFFSAILVTIAQDNKRGLNIQVMEDRSRRPATENDSILSASIDNNIIKNTDAKIEDYLIISSEMDTISVDTSLTIEKYYKMNYLSSMTHFVPWYLFLTFVTKSMKYLVPILVCLFFFGST